MTAGSRSSPAITSAGSPGSRCCSVKIMIDTKNSVGISCTMRRARKFSMGFLAPLAGTGIPCSFEFQPDHAHQPIRHLPVAFELLDMRDQPLAVVEIDDRLVVEHDPGQLLIDRLALRGIGG